MQATAKTDRGSIVIADDSESEYVGKHRPHRMSLLRPRALLGRTADRSQTAAAK